MRARAIRWVLFSVAFLEAACGHDVTPTPDYSKPENIPICCTSDPTARCCGLVAYAYSQGIVLSWNVEDPIFAFIDGWLVYRAVGESEPPDSAYHRLFSEPYTFSAYRDDQITDGVRYWYRLTSVSPAGVESVPTLPAGVRADFTPPEVPTGLSALVTTPQVTLQWNASPASDLDHYNIFRAPEFPPLIFPRAYVADFLDRTVKPDSTYRYWVTAVDQGLNESAPSETVEVRVPLPASQ